MLAEVRRRCDFVGADVVRLYEEWLRTIRHTGVDGALYWILSAEEDNGTLYADYDGFTVYCPSPVCSLITAHADLVPSPLKKPQTLHTTIADNDAVTIERDTVVQIDIVANDVSLSVPIRTRTLDLDPATNGRQSTITRTGGTLTIVSEGIVSFTAEPGFTGRVDFPYSVGNGLTTSTATLSVTVRPAPGDPVVIASWESGLEGWAAANWQSDPGTLTVDATGATDGVSALQVNSNGAWFGSPADSPALDLSARAAIEFDLTTAAAGTSVSIAVRYGDAWTWCQSPWEYVAENTSTTVTAPLDTFGCAAADLTAVHDVLIFFNAGQYSVDRLTVE